MNARLEVRLMSHYVDHVTRTTGNYSKRGGWAGTFATLAVVLVICTVLLWADRAFV